MKSVFITGTDTGVGKTILAAALLSAARRRGADAVPMKPIQTGCIPRGDRLAAPDLDRCLELTGLAPAPEELEWMCPYRFEPACSPHLAASMARTTISIDTIVECFMKLGGKHRAVAVEGAGGVFVPVSGRHTMLDVMKALNLPILLVARPGLGTLNHTLLSLHALRQAELSVEGVVLVESRAGSWGLIEEDNLRTLAKAASVPIVARFPYLVDLTPARFAMQAAPWLHEVLENLWTEKG